MTSGPTTRRPGPPAAVALILGVAILGGAFVVGYFGANPPVPEVCLEACGFSSWVAVGFAVIFGGSALFNLLLLVVALTGRASRETPLSLRAIVISQGVLIAAAIAWVAAALLDVAFLGLIASFGIIGGSLAVCIFTGIVLSAWQPRT